jgi:hypothetical protein
MREYSRARSEAPAVSHAIREWGPGVFAYISKSLGIGSGLLTLVGCITFAPPTHSDVQEALEFALAHTGLPEAPPPPVHLTSSQWMGAQIGMTDSKRVRGLYVFSCRCIYLDEHSWTMPILVHEMVHYLEHAAGLPAGHERADPVGELYAEVAE